MNNQQDYGNFINMNEDNLGNPLVIQYGEYLIQNNQELYKKNIQTNTLCQLCQIQQAHHQIDTLAQNYIVCIVCFELIKQYVDINEKAEIVYRSVVGRRSRQNIFKTSKSFKLYNLKFGTCIYCLDSDTVLCKVGICDHYLCFECFSNTIHSQLITRFSVQCLQCNCQVDDYLILQFKQWYKLIKPKFCCYNKICKVIMNCEPYQPLQTQNIQEIGQKAYCTQCKVHFCSQCWTKHKNSCDFEGLFKEYCKSYKLINCPNCHVICEPHHCPPSYGIIHGRFIVQNQQCPLCNHNFCRQCLGNLQLFGKEDFDKAVTVVTCESCKNKYESLLGILKRLIPEIGLHLLVLLVVIIGFIFLIIYKLLIIFKDTNILVFQQFKQQIVRMPILVIIIILPLCIILFILLVAVLFVFQCFRRAIGWVKWVIHQIQF